MILVSILIPIYNVEKYIERCARSLFCQTYNDIEFVFVDDCSPDNSVAILQNIINEYPERKNNVKIIRHEINKGLSSARNTALKASSGIYIMHVDSDDYIENNTVELAVYSARQNDADMVVFDMNYIFNNSIKPYHVKIPDDNMVYLKKIIYRDISPCLCGSMYKRKLYIDNNIRAIEGLNYGEDYVTKPRLIFYAKQINYLPLCLYNYVQYNQSSYTNSVSLRSIHDILKAISILDVFFAKNSIKNYDNISMNMKIRNKIFLLEYCNSSDRVFINSLFQDLNSCSIKVNLKHRIVWELSRRNMIKLLNIYIYI